MPDAALANAEDRYLRARDLHDRLEVGRARGGPIGDLERDFATEAEAARTALAGIEPAAGSEDERAIATMRRWLDETLASGAAALPVAVALKASACDDESGWAEAATAGFRALAARLEGCYAARQSSVAVDGEVVSRAEVLARLAGEPRAERRRRLFLTLEPVWRAVDGDGSHRSPYRELIRLSAERWREGRSPVAANARALGIDPASVEPQLVAVLEAWRAATAVDSPIEPWDWWYRAGAAERALRSAIPFDRLRVVSDGWHAALGADPAALGIRFDVTPRPDRPPIPVAFTTFGARPRCDPATGRWTTGEPWIFASYRAGGLGELTELAHETGHAIHIAAIRTRPAFADWPDSDALTEALAELTSLDTAEPRWQERWLGTSLPVGESLRGRYADVLLDVCWALLEIRLHADPDRAPNEVWTELTSRYLGIAPHPGWSWWAMRGQLVQEPGYMANYAIGAILAADLRATIRAARGEWTTGDAGWYEFVSERIYRFGLERTSGEVLRAFLGRAPSAEALLKELARIGR